MAEPTIDLQIQCPYCGESVDVFIEADVSGELIQDCEVCCNPWLVRIERRAADSRIEVRTLDD